jgi:hypothetical protein
MSRAETTTCSEIFHFMIQATFLTSPLLSPGLFLGKTFLIYLASSGKGDKP